MEAINNIVQLEKFLQTKDTTDKKDSPFALYHDTLSSLNLKHNNVEVRDSSIHGKGVFATKKIPKDAIITFYPIDAIHSCKTLETLLPSNSPSKFESGIENHYLHEYGYTYRNEKNESTNTIIGDPFRHDELKLVGHMINDSSTNVFSSIKYEDVCKIEICKNAILKYYADGKTKRNCEFIEVRTEALPIPVCCCIATRNIKAGEEILLTYEHLYWYVLTYRDFMKEKYECDNLLRKALDTDIGFRNKLNTCIFNKN